MWVYVLGSLILGWWALLAIMGTTALFMSAYLGVVVNSLLSDGRPTGFGHYFNVQEVLAYITAWPRKEAKDEENQ